MPAPALTVAGDLPRTGALSAGELFALGTVSGTWNDHGTRHAVIGVPIERVLLHFGFAPGKMGKGVPPRDKRGGWKLVVVASAPDGFQAVFSAAELAADMGPTRVLVVWEIDGKPLDAATGPLRLCVLTDQEPSRSLHQLRRLDIVDMRRIVNP